jgi:redox-sensitive bicupin YhaK (pirin superfamily)
MSAGTGIRHSEYNAEGVPARMFQIWLAARDTGTQPRWATRRFPKGERSGRFVTLASGRADGQALSIGADADVLGAAALAGEDLVLDMIGETGAYVVPAAGRITINGVELAPGDGAAVTGEKQIAITAIDDTEIVVVLLY